jgi:hypothetical protein
MLLDALAVVERLNLRYAVMGGFAVRSWGIPRPTYDADLAVAGDPADLRRLLDALEKAGFDVPQEYRAGFLDTLAGMQKIKVTRFEVGAVWSVDIFLAHGGLLASALGRRRSRTVEGHGIWVMAPEDVILLKLIAFRRKDQLDVEEMLRITADIDRDYLYAWADRLELRQRLREFLP